MTKVCSRCKVEKSKLDYYRYSRAKDNLQRWCKSCCSKEGKVWENKNRERRKLYRKERYCPISARDYQLRHSYGISLEEYDKVYTSQNGKCFICSEPHETLFVDHCHTTKKVRSLLCRHCNLGIGFFKDNVRLLKEAIKYLEKGND